MLWKSRSRRKIRKEWTKQGLPGLSPRFRHFPLNNAESGSGPFLQVAVLRCQRTLQCLRCGLCLTMYLRKQGLIESIPRTVQQRRKVTCWGFVRRARMQHVLRGWHTRGSGIPEQWHCSRCHEMDFEPSERLTNINKYKHCSAFYFCFSKKLRKRKPGSFIGDCHQSGWVGRRSGFTDLFSFRPVVTGGIAPQKHFCAPQILF